jgi:hypothetical protein
MFEGPGEQSALKAHPQASLYDHVSAVPGKSVYFRALILETSPGKVL